MSGKLSHLAVFAVAAALLAIASVRCGSSSQTSTGPSPVRCQVAVSTPGTNLDATGGTGSVTVSTEPECAWTASTTTSWISGLSPVSGQGTGRVEFRVPANPAPAMRQGEVVVNGTNAVVRQEGSPCQFQVAPLTHTIEANGGTMSVSVSTDAACAWTASESDGWISIMSGDRGTGGGTVTLQVVANTAGERTSVVTVAGQAIRITQAAAAVVAPCTFVITPARASVGAAGGAGPPVAVETAASCEWTATTSTPWISITSDGTGRGPGDVTYSVAANPGERRSGTIAVAGQTFEIDQDEATPCRYAVSPATVNAGAAGGTAGPINVSTSQGCGWTAASNASWITVPAGSRSGNGSLSFTVAANTGNARTGSVTVAGTAVSVAQAAGSRDCTFTIAPQAQTVGAAGGAGTPVRVTTAAECAWSAATTVPWITLGDGAVGTGNGSIAFTVTANTGGSRTGQVTIAGQTATVTQQAAPTSPAPPSCSFGVSPTHDEIDAEGGGNGETIHVTAAAGCSWTATTDAPWITITAGSSGVGNGAVVYRAAPNTGGRRSATLNVAGRQVTVEQEAARCDFAVTPASQSIAATGGAGAPISVSTRADCEWTAVSRASWLTITAGASGAGNGTVAFTAAPNSGGSRTGELTIAGRTVNVTQPEAQQSCSFSVAPANTAVAAGGGAGPSIAVTTSGNCAWTATSQASWLTITAGASGTGNGTVAYTAAANTGAERTGTLTVAGRPVTVTQAAAAPTPPPCTYSIAPGGGSVPASGGAGPPVTVTTGANCTWTAASNAPWLTITAGASGMGGGGVAYTASANTGPQRTGTLTIAGHTFTVTQASGCSYSINPTSQTVVAAGGPGSTIAVTTATGCAWTATSNASWLTIVSGASGSGNGSVGFTVASNSDNQRSGTLTVAGQTFTVTQAAGPSSQPMCNYSIAPASQSVGSLGSVGNSIAVTTSNSCDWTAVSNAEWIVVTAGSSGRGNGKVSYSVAANLIGQRVGTITIATQTFTVTQAGVLP